MNAGPEGITESDVAMVLQAVLGLETSEPLCRRETPLLGAVPQLDSMAAVALLQALEERFSIRIADDEVSAELFSTVGSLVDFVNRQMAQSGTRGCGSLV